MAPEVIDGVTRQTKWSDNMYAVGGILYKIIDNHFFDQLPAEHRHTLVSVARNCRRSQYSQRLSAQKALQLVQQALRNNCYFMYLMILYK